MVHLNHKKVIQRNWDPQFVYCQVLDVSTTRHIPYHHGKLALGTHIVSVLGPTVPSIDLSLMHSSPCPQAVMGVP